MSLRRFLSLFFPETLTGLIGMGDVTRTDRISLLDFELFFLVSFSTFSELAKSSFFAFH